MTFDPLHWYQVKQFFEHSTGWPMDTLHVMAGVILQLLVAALTRRSLRDRLPWLTVLVAELANETYDLWVERWPSLGMQVGEGMRDVLGTMLLPTILWWLARRRPRLLSGR